MGALGGLGGLLDRFFIDFYRFWSRFGDPFGRVWGVLGELLGGSGLSWGLLGALLELLGWVWGLYGSFHMFFYKIFVFFPRFFQFSRSGPQRDPPCPAPQRTPACSNASRPAAVPSALPRVPPRNGPQRAPHFSPSIPHLALACLKFLQLPPTSSLAYPSSPRCAFRFPREVRFTGLG